jgi:two-component sensor histidine kinase
LLTFINRLLNLGTSGDITPHVHRKIWTTNLLNFIVALYLIISYTKYFILREHFHPLASTVFLALAVTSILLGAFKRTHYSFILFAINVNASVFFFNMYYPPGAGVYLFYFPLCVVAVLLNNPSVKDKYSIIYSVIFLVLFIAYLVLDAPAWRMSGLTPYQERALWYYDLVMSVAVTAILSFLLARVISSQTAEIAEQNVSLRKAKDDLNVSLKEKEILLAELHHRIKNNLAIISGLLNLQQDSVSNVEAKEIIGDSRNRILSMALVHKMLFENHMQKDIDAGKYFSELICELFNSYDLRDSVVILEEYDKVVLPVSKSIPLGLILNEIVTNSIKYVYKQQPSKNASFVIKLKEGADKTLFLTIKDSGHGFPKDFNVENESVSLGIFLIKNLAEQIDGNVKFSNENGAKVELSFNN